MRRALLAAAPLLALAACRGERSDQSAASAQVLPASVSDAMIPYDQLRSQPPLAAPDPRGTARRGPAMAPDAAPSDASGEATGSASEAARPVSPSPEPTAASAPG